MQVPLGIWIGYVEGHLRSDVYDGFGYRSAMDADVLALAVGQVPGESAHVRETHHPCWLRQFDTGKAAEPFECAVDYSYLHARAGDSGLMPGCCEVSTHALTGYVAVGRLGRDDFPHPDDAGLLRDRSQESQRHVGFDVVLAHVARVAAVVLQVADHGVHVAGQVNGHSH